MNGSDAPSSVFRQYIGNRLRELRELRHLTVRQLAELSGVPYQNVTKLENGRYNASIDIIGKLVSALEASMTIDEKKPRTEK